MQTRKLLFTTLIVGLTIIFIIYGAIEARGIFFGPRVDLSSPLEGSTMTEPVILFEGETSRTKELTINGNKILLDTAGKFSVNLVLSPGYNIITIVATDARGSQHTTTSHLYYESEWFEEKVNEIDNVSASTSSSTISSTTAEESYSN